MIDRGLQGIGVDISEEMLTRARKYVPQGKFYKQDFTKLEFKQYFDAIVSFFALNHIEKRKFIMVIKRCRKLLKKDGFLMLGMVKGKNEGFFDGFYDQKMKLYGSGYTKKELGEILKSQGYKIVKSGITSFRGQYFKEKDIYILAKRV